MILSENANGKVLKTSGRGYSIRKIFDRVYSIPNVEDIHSFSQSFFTGSAYIKFSYKGVFFDIRVSNHTKRSDSPEINENISIEENKVWAAMIPHPTKKGYIMPDESKGKIIALSCDFEIVNTKTSKIFFDFIKTLK